MSALDRPGDRSLFWCIVRNDLRLYWRGNANQKMAWATGTLARVASLLLMHVVVWALIASNDVARGGPEAVCAAVLAILAMGTLHRALEVLYNRGDLTLLLSSPVPPRVVLLTRLVDVALTSLLGTMTLVVPLANVAILLFGWQWAWSYLVWVAVVFAAAPLSVLATIVAVERLGAKRARTVLQVVGLLFGMGMMLVTQLPQLMHRGASRLERRAAREAMQTDLCGWFEVPPLQQLAAAAAGAWQWLLPVVCIGPVFWWLAQRSLALRFTHGAQGAASDAGGATGRSTASTAWATAFTRSRGLVLVRAQWLLLRRDPLLLMRCAMQIVSLVPLMLVAFMLKAAAGIGGLGIMAAAVVPLQLAALRNANDEGSDFEAASPLPSRERARVRMIGTASPLVVFAWAMAIATGVLAGLRPAVMVAVGGTLIALASAWLGTCTTRVLNAEERSRNQQPRLFWQMLVAMLLGGLGAGAVGAAMSPQPWIGWILFVVSLALAGTMFLASPRLGTEHAE